MTARARLILVVAWALSLAGVAAVAQPKPDAPLPPRPGTVISGTDLGFRVESTNEGSIAGTLVVRMNGRWVPVEHVSSPRIKKLTGTP